MKSDECTKCTQVRTIVTCITGKCTHTSLNSSLCATASKHSCPVLSTESVNSTNSPLSSWIRVTRQLLLETVYLRVLLSFKPNGKGMLHTWGLHLGKSVYSPWNPLRNCVSVPSHGFHHQHTALKRHEKTRFKTTSTCSKTLLMNISSGSGQGCVHTTLHEAGQVESKLKRFCRSFIFEHGDYIALTMF